MNVLLELIFLLVAVVVMPILFENLMHIFVFFLLIVVVMLLLVVSMPMPVPAAAMVVAVTVLLWLFLDEQLLLKLCDDLTRVLVYEIFLLHSVGLGGCFVDELGQIIVFRLRAMLE